MPQRPTKAAHDSRASTRSGRGTRPFAASCPDARPAPIAPAPPPRRGRRRFESACATVPGRRPEVHRFLYTDFVLTRLVSRLQVCPAAPPRNRSTTALRVLGGIIHSYPSAHGLCLGVARGSGLSV